MLPGINITHPLALAPMDDITDQTVRLLARRFGADLLYTEFISAEGLRYGAEKSFKKMEICAEEHPVAIQVFGSRIDSIVEAALLAERKEPDYVDLNFGCPAKKVAGKGGGAGLLRDPGKLEAMARSVVKALSLPVTAKVRLGWDESSINVIDICRRLEDVGIRMIAVHARTRSQSYGVPADWSWIKRVKDQASIPIIGNGDIRTPDDALRMLKETGCDGLMIGHGAMGNPWVFREIRHFLNTGEELSPPLVAERVGVLLEHLRASIQVKGERRATIEIRKHYKGYLKSLPGISKVRSLLMEQVEFSPIEDILGQYLKEMKRDDSNVSGTPDQRDLPG